MSETDVPAKTVPRRAELAVLLGLLTAIGPLAIDMYLPAFPRIATDFAVPDAQVQLSLTACLVGLAFGQLICGPLSDRWGRRRPIVVAVVAYAVCALLCAVAPSAPMLVVFRLLQGFSGGAAVVVARALVRDVFSGVAAAKFFSQLSLVFGVAPIAAPSLGSAVLKLTSWHGIFVAQAILALLLVALIAWRLPETLPPERRSPGSLGDLGRTARTLITDKIFIGYAFSQALGFAAMFAYISSSPFVLQNGYGLSPATFSILFGVNACGLIALSQVNGKLLDRFAPRTLLVTTLALQVVAGVLALTAALLGNLVLLAVGLFLLVSAIGMLTPNSTALALDRLPSRAGSAAALLGGIQSVIAASVAPLAGLVAAGQGVPMGVAILGSAALALLSLLVLASR